MRDTSARLGITPPSVQHFEAATLQTSHYIRKCTKRLTKKGRGVMWIWLWIFSQPAGFSSTEIHILPEGLHYRLCSIRLDSHLETHSMHTATCFTWLGAKLGSSTKGRMTSEVSPGRSLSNLRRACGIHPCEKFTKNQILEKHTRSLFATYTVYVVALTRKTHTHKHTDTQAHTGV